MVLYPRSHKSGCHACDGTALSRVDLSDELPDRHAGQGIPTCAAISTKILSALTGQVMLDPYCSAVQRVSLPDGAQVDFVCVFITLLRF